MQKAVLKGLALSFGGGLALGAGVKIGFVSSRLAGRRSKADLNGLRELIRAVDQRVKKVEVAGSGADLGSQGAVDRGIQAGLASAIEASLAVQSSLIGDIDNLRSEIHSVAERGAKQCSDLSRMTEQLESKLSNIVLENLSVRLNDMELRLRRDLEEDQRRSIEVFGHAIQTGLVQQITAVEHTLAEQSATVLELRDTSKRTSQNLQKMMDEIERLCDESKRPIYAPAAIDEPGDGSIGPQLGRNHIQPHTPALPYFNLDRSRPDVPTAEPLKARQPIAKFSLS